MNRLWNDAGECRRWLTLAASNPAVDESAELARCHSALAAEISDDLDASLAEAVKSAEIAQRVGSEFEHLVARQTIGRCMLMRGEFDGAREHFLACIESATPLGDNVRLGHLHDYLGFVTHEQGDLVGSLRWHEQAYEFAAKVDYAFGMETFTQNVACQLRLLGRSEEAFAQLRSIIRAGISTGDTDSMTTLSEDLACSLVDVERFREAAVLFGAADAARLQFHRAIDPPQARLVSEPIATARERLGASEWALAFEQGQQTRLDVALTAHAPD